MTNTLLCIGYGFSARALTPLLLPLGWSITGTTRSAERAEAMRAEGVTPIIWSGTDLDDALKAASHLLISAAPSPGVGDPLLASLDLGAYGFDWVGYLSTTGVYGNHDGAWVDESTPLTPSTGRGELRVAAESAWPVSYTHLTLPTN